MSVTIWQYRGLNRQGEFSKDMAKFRVTGEKADDVQRIEKILSRGLAGEQVAVSDLMLLSKQPHKMLQLYSDREAGYEGPIFQIFAGEDAVDSIKAVALSSLKDRSLVFVMKNILKTTSLQQVTQLPPLLYWDIHRARIFHGRALPSKEALAGLRQYDVLELAVMYGKPESLKVLNPLFPEKLQLAKRDPNLLFGCLADPYAPLPRLEMVKAALYEGCVITPKFLYHAWYHLDRRKPENMEPFLNLLLESSKGLRLAQRKSLHERLADAKNLPECIQRILKANELLAQIEEKGQQSLDLAVQQAFWAAQTDKVPQEITGNVQQLFFAYQQEKGLKELARLLGLELSTL